MRRLPVALCTYGTLLIAMTATAGQPPAPAGPDARDGTLSVPRIDADPRIPTLKTVLDYSWGDEISSPAQIERYLQALAQAAPDRARLVPYGKTYEGHGLYYLVVSSPENMSRLDAIRRSNLRLADPQGTPADVAAKLIGDAPALVWLAYSVHGNELSCSDAALLTAYHLLADRSKATRSALRQLVVLIDPLQNPDGRQRFISVYRETRGRFPEPEPWASEHTERWPGGRYNHYLFDMNRDWFFQSQRETRSKVAAYLHWQPHIYVDAHEMGRNSTYFFDPPTDPINPFLLPGQVQWLFRLGRHQALWFDRYGFAYTTREMFDAFYPGYGSEWPMLQGGLGVLWEQAGSRGLVIDRDDDTKLHFRTGVTHHYVSALATIEAVADHRESLVRSFYEARRRGVQLGREGPVKHYFLLEGRRPANAFRLAQILRRNGIRVTRTTRPLKVICTDVRHGRRQPRGVPPGSYHVPVAQPAGRLARVLLDRRVDMEPPFVQRQLDRKQQRLPDELYDVTAWSLPLACDVDCLWTEKPVDVADQPWAGVAPTGQVVGGQAKVAYLVAGDDGGAVRALAWWLRAGYRVHVADKALTLGEVDFPTGTLILRTHENPQGLHQAVRKAAHRFHLTIHATDTGFVTEGAHLGGPFVSWVRPPRIAMLFDRPTSYSVGHTWYLLDQVWGYPAARVAGRNLGQLDLRHYNVLIFPDGNYEGADGPKESDVARIKEWVKRGGTLILVKGAAAWATGENVGLVASHVVKKPVEADKLGASDTAEDSSATPTKHPAMESPDAVPGAFLRADVFDQHWVTFGVRSPLDVFCSGNLILAPVEPHRGRNLVTFRARDELLTSGFCWPKTLELIARKPYVIYQSSGQGHIIALAGDPDYRAMYPSLQRLMWNAITFGPGH